MSFEGRFSLCRDGLTRGGGKTSVYSCEKMTTRRTRKKQGDAMLKKGTHLMRGTKTIVSPGKKGKVYLVEGWSSWGETEEKHEVKMRLLADMDRAPAR